jgi:hypothetical protein
VGKDYLEPMKRLVFLWGCLLGLVSSPVLAQTVPDMIVVRIVTPVHRIVITRGEGRSEVLKMDVHRNIEKGLIDINEAYYRLLKQLAQEGYVLQQQLGGGESSSTLLFVKSAPKP